MDRRDGKNQHHPIPDPVEKHEMMEIIWERRREHVPFAEIGEELGISGKTAWKYFHEYQLFLVPPSVEQERLLHIEQIQALLADAYRLKARTTDIEIRLKIIAEIRALMKDYRTFMGMNAATKLDVRNRSVTEFDAEMEDLASRFSDFADPEERAAEKSRDARKGKFQR